MFKSVRVSGEHGEDADKAVRKLVRNNPRVLVITGAYYPAPGGAANYYRTLAHLLTVYEVAGRVEVWTERYTGVPNCKKEGPLGLIHVRRIMARRASRERRGMFFLPLYIVQIFQIAVLLLSKAQGFDAVFLHSSLIYRTKVLSCVVSVLKRFRKSKFRKTRYILDVRDPLMPRKMAHAANKFDAVISCSKNVYWDLLEKGVHAHRIHEIPIPLDEAPADEEKASALRKRLGLAECDFAFVAHGFAEGKRTEEIVDAMAVLRNEGVDLRLAVAGRTRQWPQNAEQAWQAGWLHVLGPLPNDEVRILMGEASIHINVCDVESIGRASLEAISARTLTVLPPGVPEFEEHCRDWIGSAGCPKKLAEEIQMVLKIGKLAPYPLERHECARIASRYAVVVQENRGACRS